MLRRDTAGEPATSINDLVPIQCVAVNCVHLLKCLCERWFGWAAGKCGQLDMACVLIWIRCRHVGTDPGGGGGMWGHPDIPPGFQHMGFRLTEWVSCGYGYNHVIIFSYGYCVYCWLQLLPQLGRGPVGVLGAGTMHM